MKINIPDFSNVQILVVGDLMLDRYWYGDTSRISPEAPVPVVHVNNTEVRAGGAGNVAVNVTSLGATATVMGLTGEDEAADALQQYLLSRNVVCEFQRLANFATVAKLRILSRHQQLIRLDFEDGFNGCDPNGFFANFQQQLPSCHLVIMSDYNKGCLQSIEQFITAAVAQNKPIVIDPKGTDYKRYRGATLLTPNLAEFEAVVGKCVNEAEIEQKGEALRRELQLKALLITRSENGMTLIQQDHKPFHLPTHAREVFDVTGAGDTVIASLAVAMAAGLDLQAATALSNLAAGIVVGKLGTASVTVAELQRAIREQDTVQSGIVSESQLLEFVNEAKAHGESVVMTNGCFDILHAGHVTYLQQAKKLGDRLVVAVNVDESVRKLKGNDRPVNSVERRMTVLAALECVDWVVPFSEDTPERLICTIKPDYLVKGGDNDPDNIPGGDCVREAGGQVMVMDYVKKLSTTELIKSIRTKKPE